MATWEAARDADRPIVQAHRGFEGVAPENTVLAARTAAERFDADWIEVDVQPTGDGTVVCFHDPALGEEEGSRNLTDATGLVRNSADDTVLSAEVLDSGETIPTLSDLIDALPPAVGLNVELKAPGGPVEDADGWLFDGDDREEQRALWNEFVPSVASVLADEERPLVLSSFFEGALVAAAEHAPSIPRAFVAAADLDEGFAVAERHDAVAINAPAARLLAAGPSFIEDAHERSLAVTAWTVTEWTTCRDLAAIGVDGLIATYPHLDATW